MDLTAGLLKLQLASLSGFGLLDSQLNFIAAASLARSSWMCLVRRAAMGSTCRALTSIGVDFGAGHQPDLFNRYSGLNEALAALFGRRVDLVMVS